MFLHAYLRGENGHFTHTEEPAWKRRVASLALPALLSRCRGVFTTYIVDEALRGNIPFERYGSLRHAPSPRNADCEYRRIREEELLYCLRKLPELRLWPGCLWAALSDNPTASSVSLPRTTQSFTRVFLVFTHFPLCHSAIDPTLSPQQLMSDATKRSPHAHLFHLYPLLYEIATVPRAPPSAWIATNRSSSLSTLTNSSSRPLTPFDSLVGVGGGGSQAPSSVEVDARQLAKTCLRVIGKEIGAEV